MSQSRHNASTKKKRTPMQRFRRWKRRLYKRHPEMRTLLPVGGIALCLALVIGIGVGAGVAVRGRRQAQSPEAEIAAPPVQNLVGTYGNGGEATQDAVLPTPTPVRTPEPTPVPTPTPRTIDGVEESLYHQLAAPAADYSDPEQNGLIATKVIRDDGKVVDPTEDTGIHMGASSQYATVEGVTTFRGSNYRDGGSYGTIPENPSKLKVVWQKKIGKLAGWGGVGWTGQASLVKWPEDVRSQMNITAEKKAKSDLVEALYATLDGKIYFLDAEDGVATRDPIKVGAPIKGSLSVDPRGLPLLYCGQSIYDVDGKRVDCGTRVWSLIDQKLLYFLDGNDKKALRAWRAFDCSPLIDADSDTMITAGENGVLYNVKLNTRYSGDSISVSPSVTRYIYKQSLAGKVGSENSVAIYNNYVYFATNIGIIQCVDLNTMSLVWSFDAKDDIDASIVLETESDGTVGLYATNELDNRGPRGPSQMFKLNALTGELLWKRDSGEIYQNNKNGGGSFATPAVGKHNLSDIVYFHVARVKDGGGVVYALDKQTGETVWTKKMGTYGWSSPTCVYTPSGKGYVLVGSYSGKLRLMDGLTGQTVAETTLHGNIEGSPAVFDDMIVIGTRSNLIYGLKIA